MERWKNKIRILVCCLLILSIFPACSPGRTQDIKSEGIPEEAPEIISEEAPEIVSEEAAGEVSGGMAENVSGEASEEAEGKMEQLYRLGLEDYLQGKLDLVKYDDMIRESELGFLPAQGENVTEQQEDSMLGTEYLYVRNDIHLNRLSGEDYALLQKEAGRYAGEITGDTELSQDIQDLVLRTFSDVISPNEIRTEEDKDVLTAFDTSGTKMFANNSVVLYIATREAFDGNGEYIDRDREQRKREWLEELCARMESDFDGALGDTPVRVFSDISY